MFPQNGNICGYCTRTFVSLIRGIPGQTLETYCSGLALNRGNLELHQTCSDHVEQQRIANGSRGKHVAWDVVLPTLLVVEEERANVEDTAIGKHYPWPIYNREFPEGLDSNRNKARKTKTMTPCEGY